MRTYLSYPMTGLPAHGIPRATKIAEYLRKMGHDLVVPHEILHGGDQHENPDYTHADYIREDIRRGLSTCDSIAMVDGWVHSVGCRDEFDYARMMSYRVSQVVEYYDTKWDDFISCNLLPIDGKGGW